MKVYIIQQTYENYSNDAEVQILRQGGINLTRAKELIEENSKWFVERDREVWESEHTDEDKEDGAEYVEPKIHWTNEYEARIDSDYDDEHYIVWNIEAVEVS